MFRRPARDRNYEFWGDQTFFGENPPQAAVISWMLKKDAGEVQLKITDATGRDVREISGPVLASSNKAGIQSACWDLRVQPASGPPSPLAAAGPRRRSGRRRWTSGRPGGGQQQSPFGAGCGGAAAVAGAAVASAAGGGNAGPYVLPGSYNVAFVVDGKVVETKPLRVSADPEVVLTDAQRKQLFDMAMEMHELQKRATEIGNALGPFNRRMGELSKEIAGKTDVPPDVKAMFDDVNKELGDLAPKFAPPQGGRGGRWRRWRRGRQSDRTGRPGQERIHGRHVADTGDHEGLHRREDADAEVACGRECAASPRPRRSAARSPSTT